MKHNYRIVIIGAGPAGTAAALGAKASGEDSILVIDRDDRAGGILNQCIHDGFGLTRYRKALSGPEYAQIDIDRCAEQSIPILTGTYVHSIEKDGERFTIRAMTEGSLHTITADAVILAMGCRERTAGAISLPGTRPAGIYTAGTAQRLLNMQNTMVGRSCVIIGSGDIGLIMARRMTLEGAEVKAVTEIQRWPGGLERNIRQCLDDFSIPLYLHTGIAAVHGKDRVTGVTIAPVKEDGTLDMDHSEQIACDTILLSVGLIPENELSRSIDVAIDPVTQGPIVSDGLMTSVPGVFACGNVLQVHDIVDLVSEEADRAGRAAAAYIQGSPSRTDLQPVFAGRNIRYCVPQVVSPGRRVVISSRVTEPLEQVKIIIADGARRITQKRFDFIAPSEMVQLWVSIPQEITGSLEVYVEQQ